MNLRSVIHRRQPALGFTEAMALEGVLPGAPPSTSCPGTWASLPVGSAANPMVDPPLAARDEAIALLHATAEIEHSLMVQYLYAAYSIGEVPPGDAREPKVKLVRHLLLHIAREEMAHLATVQNLLHLLGGPLHLDREHSPFSSQLLPFRFKLEPLSIGSLAKYVIAESPRSALGDGPLTPAEIAELRGEVTNNAKASNDGICPGHVGDIFARLIWLFKLQADGANQLRLDDEDFLGGTENLQANWQDWGFNPKPRTIDGVTIEAEPSIVRQFAGGTAAQRRSEAVAALEAIADQGEGADAPTGGTESHFDWFRLMYAKFKEVAAMPGGFPVHAVPINPNTAPEQAAVPHYKMVDAGMIAAIEAGRISHPRSKRWAQLFNLRYRILLEQLHHFLRTNTDRYTADGDRTARGYLLIGVFHEMRRLKAIAGKLVALPKTSDAGDSHRAGPPFELPFTTQLADGETTRWRAHLATTRAALALITKMLEDPADAGDPFLLDVKAADTADHARMVLLVAGQPLPPVLPEFPKVVQILEEAVRGFTVGKPHGNFWAKQTVTTFPSSFGTNVVVAGNPSASVLLTRMKVGGGAPQMPRERPPVPASRIAFVEAWILAGCPDSNPPYAGLERERDPLQEMPVIVPATGPSFDAKIKPLFTPEDVSCMEAIGGFNLSKYADVKTAAARIFARLDDGSMPTSGRWPQADIDLFKSWIDAGFPE